LGVGDFDGDGIDDLFLATGAAWYYSPGSAAEWRFLSAKTETMDKLLIGDFDGDGRADVFTQIGDDWMVSWGGISPWQKINHSIWRMKDFVVGDFVGDSRADVFFARGDQWFVSDGGLGPFVPFAQANQKISELRFGDFDGDKKTDILGIVDHQYMVVYAKPDAQGNRFWQPLRPKLSDNFNNVFVADFDGNGISDIAVETVHPHRGPLLLAWWLYPNGSGDRTPLSGLSHVASPAAIGKFDPRYGSDVLLWDHLSLRIVYSGQGASIQQSRQDMR
jgi:FG-GAP-like repeat